METKLGLRWVNLIDSSTILSVIELYQELNPQIMYQNRYQYLYKLVK